MAARFQKGFVPELDGLRAFAVLAVLWSHLPAGALGSTVTALGEEYVVGNVGVDLFFVLSGFLITRILLVDREREVPLRWFLARRFLRIFPIYYLTIAVVSPRLSSFETWASLSYTSNYAFIFHEEHGPLDHTWSLAVEEHFYLLWPPLVAFLAPRASRRALLLGIVPLAVLSVVLGLALWDWDVHAQALIEFELRSSTVRFFSLALGALLAFHETALRARRGLALGVAVGCAAACYLISERGVRALGLMGGLESAFSGGAPFGPRVAALQVLSIPFGSAAAVVLAFAFTGARGPFHALLRAAPLRWIGRISYGLYLYHLPIFFSEVWDVRAGTYQPLRVAAVVAVTFAVAWVSFQTFERLFLGFSARFREGGRDVPVPRPGWGKIALAALFAVGLAKTLNGGAPAAV
ncbi:MAG: acyltransferase, partial [Planctomycetota bacterium]